MRDQKLSSGSLLCYLLYRQHFFAPKTKLILLMLMWENWNRAKAQRTHNSRKKMKSRERWSWLFLLLKQSFNTKSPIVKRRKRKSKWSERDEEGAKESSKKTPVRRRKLKAGKKYVQFYLFFFLFQLTAVVMLHVDGNNNWRRIGTNRVDGQGQ